MSEKLHSFHKHKRDASSKDPNFLIQIDNTLIKIFIFLKSEETIGNFNLVLDLTLLHDRDK